MKKEMIIKHDSKARIINKKLDKEKNLNIKQVKFPVLRTR